MSPSNHRCSLGITTAQKEHIEATNIVPQEWFGNGISVPVKDSVDAAIEVLDDANDILNNELPDFVLTFFLPLRIFHKWIDNGTMTRVNYLSGYRIRSNLDLKVLDSKWKVHPVQ